MMNYAEWKEKQDSFLSSDKLHLDYCVIPHYVMSGGDEDNAYRVANNRYIVQKAKTMGVECIVKRFGHYACGFVEIAVCNSQAFVEELDVKHDEWPIFDDELYDDVVEELKHKAFESWIQSELPAGMSEQGFFSLADERGVEWLADESYIDVEKVLMD